jgi:hypothetical protein
LKGEIWRVSRWKEEFSWSLRIPDLDDGALGTEKGRRIEGGV